MKRNRIERAEVIGIESSRNGAIFVALSVIFCHLLIHICHIPTVHAKDSESDERQVDSRIKVPDGIESSKSLKESKVTKRYHLLLKGQLEGYSLRDQQQNEQYDLLKGSIGPVFQYKLNSVFSVHGDLAASFETGRVQSTYLDEKATSEVRIKETVFRFTPLSWFQVDAGALNQGQLENPLLISERPFPGISEKLSLSPHPSVEVGLRAQQTIATSETLSTEAQDKEPTPYFYSETFFLNWKPLERVKLKGRATHFLFKDLPGTVAAKSEVRGNQTQTLNQTEDQFRYGFSGWETGGSIETQFSSEARAELGFGYVKNSEAPGDRGQAQRAFLETSYRFPSGFEVAPRGELFTTQSDVTAAYYTSEDLGNNNRNGWAAQLKFIFPNEGFSLTGRYIQSNELEPNPYQSDLRVFLFRLEVWYDQL